MRRLKGVFRVDLLVTLQSMWGASITSNRKMLYDLVAGKGTDSELYQRMRYFYLRHAAFSNFVDQIYYFGGTESNLLRSIIVPARNSIMSYQQRCIEQARLEHTAVLGLDADYLYLTDKVHIEGCEEVPC